jgi:hypothetical protein
MVFVVLLSCLSADLDGLDIRVTGELYVEQIQRCPLSNERYYSV